jgi:hypothetical protein
MNKLDRYIITKLLFLFFAILAFNSVKAQEQIHLFPDKSFAVSGDTIWFQIFIYGEPQGEISQVIHVQLDGLENKHILKVSVLCQGAFGEGYISVPDSLASGVYKLSAFSLQQNNSSSAVVNQKFIHVYNRFNSELNSVQSPADISKNVYKQDNTIEIKTDRENYKRGENVQVSFTVPQTEIGKYKKVWVTVGISDPISEQYLTSSLPVQIVPNTESTVSLVEKDGILFSGHLTDRKSGEPVPGAIVLFSIPDSVPFFDYCVTDDKGLFNFYLRNAVGTADLILQAVTKNQQDCLIELNNYFLETKDILTTEKLLAFNESRFVDEIVKASYFEKLFTGYNIVAPDYFFMPRQFDYPFYGEPTRTFDPNLFFDLPDFQEISREILVGVQYRDRKDGITIRMLNNGNETIFDKEPLKLLDGIPVFNNEKLKPLNTEDILKVDVVFFERFFGDLTFPGVLSVYTKNRSIDWVDSDPQIAHFEFNCLQPALNSEFKNERVPNTHIPNLNKVLFRRSYDVVDTNNTFSFYTSDLTGNVNIRFIIVDENNQILFCQKLISVE